MPACFQICWDRHPGAIGEPVACEYNGAWVEQAELPADALVFVFIRDEQPEPVANTSA